MTIGIIRRGNQTENHTRYVFFLASSTFGFLKVHLAVNVRLVLLGGEFGFLKVHLAVNVRLILLGGEFGFFVFILLKDTVGQFLKKDEE